MFLNAAEWRTWTGRAFYATAAGIFLAFSIFAGHHNPALYIVACLVVFTLYRIFSDAPGEPSPLMACPSGARDAGAGHSSAGRFCRRRCTALPGVLPLLLVFLALLRFRHTRFVQFFALLMAASLLYALGHFSLLHGLAYALAPWMDKARQSVRAPYPVHFSMALLAGFGADGSGPWTAQGPGSTAAFLGRSTFWRYSWRPWS